MKEIPLNRSDTSFSYQGIEYTLSSMRENPYTGTWTFNLSWRDNKIYGVPVTGGTNIVKGNGTPFLQLIFIDYTRTDGDVVDLDNTRFYIIEEEDM